MEPSPARNRLRADETSTFVPVASDPYFLLAAATIRSRLENSYKIPAAMRTAMIPGPIRTLLFAFMAIPSSFYRRGPGAA
jgi:hypothetical protein